MAPAAFGVEGGVGTTPGLGQRQEALLSPTCWTLFPKKAVKRGKGWKWEHQDEERWSFLISPLAPWEALFFNFHLHVPCEVRCKEHFIWEHVNKSPEKGWKSWHLLPAWLDDTWVVKETYFPERVRWMALVLGMSILSGHIPGAQGTSYETWRIRTSPVNATWDIACRGGF